MKRHLFYWLLFIAWVGLVWGLSYQSSPPGADFFHHRLGEYADEIYHFVAYMAGGYLAYISVSSVRLAGGPFFRQLLAFTLPLAVAGVDESIQSLIPGRTADVLDIGIDAMGVAFALIAIVIAVWTYRRLRGDSPSA